MTDRNALRARLADRLAPAGQLHLLQFWDELTPQQQDELARQIDSLDLELFASLRKLYGGTGAGGYKQGDHRAHWAALAARATSPPALRLDGSGVDFTKQAAIEKGEELLRSGQVAMMLVAGGLGTRLGWDEPKGMFPIGPLSRRSFFQLFIESLLAVRRKYGAAIPLYVMTSPATDEKTREYLAANDYFGLPPGDVFLFCQGTMFAVDDRFERILRASPGELVLAPDGHGGMLRAFDRSGGLQDCRRRGVTTLFYGQIDNPLLQTCDPLLLGSHLLAGSEMTTQVVRKRRPLERVGVLVSANGRVQMIEYSDLPSEAAHETLPDGSLKFWAGNLAVHAFDLNLLQRAAGKADALPFHIAHKKTPYIDDEGKQVVPDKENAYRFERFIFDLLHIAERSLVVEVDPAEAFAPVKNSDAEATDNPRLARQAIMAQHRRWLRVAGVQVADDVAVEINPLFAASSAELATKLKPGTIISEPTYFSPTGPVTIPAPSP
jgi:UDP-N-acetylglucosamine/UDP-N-acetylgalactosamine diphosphorylase